MTLSWKRTHVCALGQNLHSAPLSLRWLAPQCILHLLAGSKSCTRAAHGIVACALWSVLSRFPAFSCVPFCVSLRRCYFRFPSSLLLLYQHFVCEGDLSPQRVRGTYLLQQDLLSDVRRATSPCARTKQTPCACARKAGPVRFDPLMAPETRKQRSL